MNKYCAHFMGSCFVPLTPLPLVYENSQLTMTNGRSSLASKVQRLFSFPDFALKVSALGCLWLGESYHLKVHRIEKNFGDNRPGFSSKTGQVI